jgi:hypothetical protein
LPKPRAFQQTVGREHLCSPGGGVGLPVHANKVPLRKGLGAGGAAVAFAETKSDYTVFLHFLFLEELLVLLNSCSLKPVIFFCLFSSAHAAVALTLVHLLLQSAPLFQPVSAVQAAAPGCFWSPVRRHAVHHLVDLLHSVALIGMASQALPQRCPRLGSMFMV